MYIEKTPTNNRVGGWETAQRFQQECAARHERPDLVASPRRGDAPLGPLIGYRLTSDTDPQATPRDAEFSAAEVTWPGGRRTELPGFVVAAAVASDSLAMESRSEG